MSELNFRIEEKLSFSVIGIQRHFELQDCYQKIPQFWAETMNQPDHPIGVFGVCYNSNETGFDYIIGDLYQPWDQIPDGGYSITCPGQRWAVFPIVGRIPEALQAVNTAIWSQWLPAHPEFQMNGNYNIELYAPPADDPEECYSEIWIPISIVGN